MTRTKYTERHPEFAERLEERREAAHHDSIRCPHCGCKQTPLLAGDTWIWEGRGEDPEEILAYICESYVCLSADVRAMHEAYAA
jgi:transposase